MKKILRYNLFIILIFSIASVFNLLSEDADGMDFLDKLLKEIEQMEATEGTKTSTLDDGKYLMDTRGEPVLPALDEKNSYPEQKKEQPRPFKKKDRRTIFIEPEVQEFKSSNNVTKIRPTKDTILAFKHYSSEFNTTSRDVNNKLEINQDLPPKFKETNFREFRQELETTNSLLDLIKDKGIYYANFLKAGKPAKSKDTKPEGSDQKPTDDKKNVRKDFLDVLKKLHALDENLQEPAENTEGSIEAMQELATQKQVRDLPKYKPLAPKTKNSTTQEPQKKSTQIRPLPKKEITQLDEIDKREILFTDDDDDYNDNKAYALEDK